MDFVCAVSVGSVRDLEAGIELLGLLRNGDITTRFPEVFSTGYRLQQSEAPS
jgi:hypothetical protein